MENKKLTFDEIIALIQEIYDVDETAQDDYGGSIEMFAHEGMYYPTPQDFEPLGSDSTYQEDIARDKRYVDTQPLGRTEQMASNGGMDKGSDWWRIYHFVKHDVYVKVSGWYASHDGTHFEDGWGSCKEVHPNEVTVIEYK